MPPRAPEPPHGFDGVAVAILAAHIIASTLWLARFEQGPLEWL